MIKAIYYGVIHKDNKSDYGVSFPDFPGCVAAEKSFEETLKSAHSVLELHIKGLLEDKETLPEPSKAEDITKDNGAIAIVPVEALVPNVKVKRYNIAARNTDMRKIDNFLKSQGRNRDRSDFLIQAALEKVNNEKRA